MIQIDQTTASGTFCMHMCKQRRPLRLAVCNKWQQIMRTKLNGKKSVTITKVILAGKNR